MAEQETDHEGEELKQSESDNVDYYEMSDEDFFSQPPPKVEEQEEDKELDFFDSGSSNPYTSEFSLDLEEEEEGEEEESDDAKQDADSEEEHEEDEKVEEENPEEETKSKKQQLDYENLYKQVTSPFKANGKEMQVDSPEEIRKLMQQGANYTKKMQAIKPNLKIIKKLGKNDLLDEGKLDFAIELLQGKPEAISKLLNDSNIDPLSLDTTAHENYQPATYDVSDAEMELDDTLDDLRDSDSITTTLEIVNDKWDKESKRIVANNPNNLRVLNEHVDVGIYDVIMTEVDKQRALGNIPTNIPDIAAYQQVGEFLKESGKLDKFFNPTPGKTKGNTSKRANTQDDVRSRRKQRKAASEASQGKTRSTVKNNQPFKKGIWEMSDDEFEQAMNSGAL